MSRVLNVDVPSVPYGPRGIPVDTADANYYRSAAENLRYHFERGHKVMGQNLTETVAQLCDAAADALEASASAPSDGNEEESS